MSAAPFRLLQLDHVVLRVRDPARMEAFYCDVLGCVAERRVEAVGLVQLRAGNSLIDLVAVSGKIGRMGGAGPGAEGRNMDHLCLRADPFDREAIVDYLLSRGVQVGEFGRRYGAEGEGPSQYLLDPEGNLVELKGPPDEVPIDTAASNAST
ncbi:VOC family protein [Lysobacter sp. S4-A87]|uniref:VOC family protein n=1 Tax=Lysobacter sp. S4-A87 TaxID=2925843 RepID=UPI001F536B58|nr:VOC family protein [Lysobacter sp. S4-A87]UNK49351.1 VOC family protein [Lysobacter sp. S4-A87]